MLTGTDRLETNEWHLHARERADSIPGSIRHIKPATESTHDHESEGVQGNHICDECITA